MGSSDAGPRFTTRVLRTPEEIAAVAEACSRCRHHQKRPPAGLAPDLAPPASQSSRVVLLLEFGQIVGFAHVKVGRQRFAWRVPVPGRSVAVARFALTSAEYIDNELIAPDDDEARATLMRGLLDACRDCSVLRLHRVACDSDIWGIVSNSGAARGGRWIVISWHPTPHWLIRTTGTFEGYMKKFTSKTRYKRRAQLNTLREACGGDLHLNVVTEREAVPAFLASAFRIARASWRPADICRLLERDCAAARLERLAENGQLLCYEMVCAGEAAAFFAGWVLDGVYNLGVCAFDLKWARYSPGAQLLALAIEDVFRWRRANWIDFGLGHLDYKQYFATDGYDELGAYLIRPGLRSAIVFGPIVALRPLRRAADLALRMLRHRRTTLDHGVQREVSSAVPDNRNGRCRDMRPCAEGFSCCEARSPEECS